MRVKQQQINPKACVNIKSTEVYAFWSSAVISCPCANLLELNFIHFKQKSPQVPTVCQQIWVVATPCSARFTDAQAQNQTAMINLSKLHKSKSSWAPYQWNGGVSPSTIESSIILNHGYPTNLNKIDFLWVSYCWFCWAWIILAGFSLDWVRFSWLQSICVIWGQISSVLVSSYQFWTWLVILVGLFMNLNSGVTSKSESPGCVMKIVKHP